MNPESINKYMTNPDLMGEKDYKELKEILNKFPFFQTAHLLFVHVASRINHKEVDSFISKSAVFISDRTFLRRVVEEENSHEEIMKTIAPKSQESVNKSEDKKLTEIQPKNKDVEPVIEKKAEVIEPKIENKTEVIEPKIEKKAEVKEVDIEKKDIVEEKIVEKKLDISEEQKNQKNISTVDDIFSRIQALETIKEKHNANIEVSSENKLNITEGKSKKVELSKYKTEKREPVNKKTENSEIVKDSIEEVEKDTDKVEIKVEIKESRVEKKEDENKEELIVKETDLTTDHGNIQLNDDKNEIKENNPEIIENVSEQKNEEELTSKINEIVPETIVDKVSIIDKNENIETQKGNIITDTYKSDYQSDETSNQQNDSESKILEFQAENRINDIENHDNQPDETFNNIQNDSQTENVNNELEIKSNVTREFSNEQNSEITENLVSESDFSNKNEPDIENEVSEEKISSEILPDIDSEIENSNSDIEDKNEVLETVLDKINAYKRKKEEERLAEQSKDKLINEFISKEPRLNVQKEPELEGNIASSSIVENEGIVTELMASIYFNQGYYQKSIEVYEKLILKNPEKKDYFAVKIKEIEEML